MATPVDLVLLLPGWGTPPARLEPLSDALQALGAVPRISSYTPEGSFEELTSQVEMVGRSLHDLHEPDDRLHLVGHSLGGIAAAAATLGELDGLVTSVTTINSPWRGTWVSYTGSGPLARTLRWGSPVLTDLRDQLARHLQSPTGPRWMLVSAAADLATPATTSVTAAMPAARLSRRVVAATGHSTSLASERLVEVVCAHILGEATASSGTWDETSDASGRR